MDTLNDIISGLKWGNLNPTEAHDRVLALFGVSGSLLPEELKYQKDLINELINMQEHPEHSNKEWKDAIISVAREKGYGNDR